MLTVPLFNSIPVSDLMEAARRAEVVAAVGEFYVEVDRRIAEHSPTCWNSGSCCRFGEYGHRLYVTTLEVAYYLAMSAPECGKGAGAPESSANLEQAPADGMQVPAIEASTARLPHALYVLIPSIVADACPHAYDRQCHVRDRRPLGCRIFFCDPNAQQWQGPFTEECLQEIKRLHWELAVPYFYADWMSVLSALEQHRTASDRHIQGSL